MNHFHPSEHAGHVQDPRLLHSQDPRLLHGAVPGIPKPLPGGYAMPQSSAHSIMQPRSQAPNPSAAEFVPRGPAPRGGYYPLGGLGLPDMQHNERMRHSASFPTMQHMGTALPGPMQPPPFRPPGPSYPMNGGVPDMGFGTNFMPGQEVAGCTYFMPDDTIARQGSDMASVPSALPHHAHMKSRKQDGFFSSTEVRKDALDKLANLQLQAVDKASDVPDKVEQYHTLIELEPASEAKDPRLGVHCSIYRAVNSKDDMVYCLRRIPGVRPMNAEMMAVVEQWRRVQHPSIVQLHHAFSTRAFGDNSLCMVHHYHPCANSLRDSIVSEQLIPKPPRGAPVPPEQLLWMYLVQLTSALRCIHSHGLAARNVNLNKILVVGKSRLWLGGCGLQDIVKGDGAQSSARASMQRDDLTSLGHVLLSVACNNPAQVPTESINSALMHVKRHYSPDLYGLIVFLLKDDSKTVNDIMPQIGGRFFTQLDVVMRRADTLEAEYMKEMECGRLFRLQAKLTAILDRPVQGHKWNETSEHYMLKLFKDYLYHMVDADNKPWVDMSHIVSCMNKLDVGSEERVQLMSTDSQTVLVVSYRELQQCIGKLYTELAHPATATAH